jgi:hypothetical protein
MLRGLAAMLLVALASCPAHGCDTGGPAGKCVPLNGVLCGRPALEMSNCVGASNLLGFSCFELDPADCHEVESFRRFLGHNLQGCEIVEEELWYSDGAILELSMVYRLENCPEQFRDCASVWRLAQAR